jgi:Tfp pilus assembly protein PilP
MRLALALFIVLSLPGSALVDAQAKPPAAAPAAPQDAAQPAPAAAPSDPKPAAATPPENYTYDAAGRRDPFLNLLGTGTPPPVGRRGEGAAGLTVAEVTVRGVMQARGQLVAMIQGPDNKTYLVHEGDKFADGTVRSVTPQGLLIIQDVNDPLSLVKQREIQKLLRSQATAKE